MNTRVINVTSGEPYDVYIGRANAAYLLPASPWRNPYTMATGTRAEAISRYRQFLLHSPRLLAALPTLRGKVLACWCAPPGGLTAADPPICHGQVLAELADAEPAAWARTAAMGGGE